VLEPPEQVPWTWPRRRRPAPQHEGDDVVATLRTDERTLDQDPGQGPGCVASGLGGGSPQLAQPREDVPSRFHESIGVEDGCLPPLQRPLHLRVRLS
jgi:hypothetical protein